MNAKRKGTRAEHRAMRMLNIAGYSCVRVAASLGVFDVIAIGAREIRLVQIKSGKRCQVSADERSRIRHFIAPPNASREIWRFFDGMVAPTIERV